MPQPGERVVSVPQCEESWTRIWKLLRKAPGKYDLDPDEAAELREDMNNVGTLIAVVAQSDRQQAEAQRANAPAPARAPARAPAQAPASADAAQKSAGGSVGLTDEIRRRFPGIEKYAENAKSNGEAERATMPAEGKTQPAPTSGA